MVENSAYDFRRTTISISFDGEGCGVMDHLLVEVKAYMYGKITLVQLQSFLTGILQAMKPSGNDAIIQLASEIDADIVWLGEGIIDVDTFHRRLRVFVLSVNSVSKSA